MQQRKTRIARRVIGAFGIVVLAAGLLVAGPTAPQAQALDLPTWDDVQAAKSNQAAANKKVKEIEKLIDDGARELDRLRNMHASTLEELAVAEAALTEAAAKTAALEEQAVTSRKEADEAAERAGAIVAQMYRSGGVDRSMEMFLDADGSTADALLERMAALSKATERNTTLSADAEQAANTADTLTQQAESAAAEREALRAEKQEIEAQAAVAVADQGTLVAAQEEQQRDLEIKLEALKDETSKTVDGYKERLRIEEEQRKAEEERLRKLAEEAARKQREAEEEARRQAEENGTGGGGGGGGETSTGGGGGGGSTGGGGGGGGTGSSNGWTYPTSGFYVSEGFRSPGRWDHTGIDLAANCWTPIVSAGPGTVGLTYWDGGGGGNMVTVNHPNGWQTRYAHMVQWASVAPGQWVEAGQLVGYVGNTGASTGCHLHFEMRPNQDNGWYDFVNPAFYIAF